VAILLVVPAGVAADAHLDSSDPADGSTIESLPETIVLEFSEELMDGSGAALRTAAGETVSEGGFDPGTPAALEIAWPEEVAGGGYEIRWTALSVDGHVTRGTVTFTYAPAATPSPTPSPSPTPEPTASPSPTPSPSPTEAPTTAPSPSPEPSEPTTVAGPVDMLLPIIAAVAVIGVLGVILLRGRGRGAGETGPGPGGTGESGGA
jgi:methionine-rich copper-binding protein CopC